MARHLCKHTSKHEAMPTNEKVDLDMIWAALNRPITVAKVPKIGTKYTYIHAHVKGQHLGTNEATLKHN